MGEVGMKRSIIIMPDARLHMVCGPVESFDKHLHKLVEDLFAVMYAHDGVGLAAPQVGVLKNIFVMDVRDGKKPHNPLSFINPELLAHAGSQEDVEGCLSLPGVELVVRRATRIHFAAQTLSGDRHQGILRGLEARVFQHELDHLSGLLMTDRAIQEAAGKH
jgi:peptide deformylase